VYLVAVGEGTRERAFALAEALRDEVPGIRVETNLGGGSFKAQVKRADKSGAAWALILGEQELSEERIGLKPLRDDAEQESIALAELAAVLKDKLGGT
jgi:histidyl-tRNA synthetase